MKNVSLVALVALTLTAVACAAETPAPTQEDRASSETPPPKPAEKKDDAKKTTGGSSSSSGSPVVTSPVEGKPPVINEPSDPRKACLEGCAAENPEGAKEFSAIVTPCACDAKACGDVCGDSCGSAKEGKDLVSTATAECRECVIAALKPGGSCNAKVMSECPKQTSCLPFGLCVQVCAQ